MPDYVLAEQTHAFIRSHGFATLFTHGENGMTATHLPLLLDPDAGPHGHLLGHMARANPQWKDIQGEALVVFSGPHAYVSPTWYETPGTVPTWNYVAVHAYGPLRLVEDRDVDAALGGLGGATATKQLNNIVFACDAGMGSSAMGASVLRNKIKKAGIDGVTVTNQAIANLDGSADLVITQNQLTDRAKAQSPDSLHVSVDNFMNSPRYDEVVEMVRAQHGSK